ncbi:hypothetical protein NP493_581g00037 [Ridgeia piscesae]|uniref:Band 7 domain-containing protein n=1 Tax=Ridgeia piscesae TaxID=27915 RepID=A0AAD9KUV1_RIDPI|nr:hypothetical protein NP493_581g00037 [Ridgeia piscesae]
MNVASVGARYKGFEDSDSSDLAATFFLCVSVIAIILTFPLTLWLCFQIVPEYKRAVVFRLGRLKTGQSGPGLIFFVPCIDAVILVDVRTVALDVPPLQILTKDCVTISVDAVVFYHVENPVMSVVNVYNSVMSTGLLSQTMLRTFLGKKTMSEILTDREHIAEAMQVINRVWVLQLY